MKNNKIQMSDILIYCVFTCIGNSLLASLVSTLIQWFIKPLELGALVTYLLLSIGTFAGYMILFFFLYREKIHNHYQPDGKKNIVLKSALSMILPGEILRFLLCLISLGSSASTGVMSIISTILFEQLYLNGVERYTIVRQDGVTNFLDIVMYIACYLLYFAIYFAVIFAIYRWVWNSRKKDRKDMGLDDLK